MQRPDHLGTLEGRLPRQLLVVEDDPVQLRAWRKLAQHYGISLSTASRTTDVLRTVLQNRPELIVMDLALEDGPSLKVLQCLRQSPETKDIPVVVISAHLTREVEAAVDEIERLPRIQKPWTLDELLPVLSQPGRIASAAVL